MTLPGVIIAALTFGSLLPSGARLCSRAKLSTCSCSHSLADLLRCCFLSRQWQVSSAITNRELSTKLPLHLILAHPAGINEHRGPIAGVGIQVQLPTTDRHLGQAQHQRIGRQPPSQARVVDPRAHEVPAGGRVGLEADELVGGRLLEAHRQRLAPRAVLGLFEGQRHLRRPAGLGQSRAAHVGVDVARAVGSAASVDKRARLLDGDRAAAQVDARDGVAPNVRLSETRTGPQSDPGGAEHRGPVSLCERCSVEPETTALQKAHASYLGGIIIEVRTNSHVCARRWIWQDSHVAICWSRRLAQTLRIVRPSRVIRPQ